MYVNYKRPNVAVVSAASGASFTFIPGINQIDNGLWGQLLENKHFKSDVDAKHYIVESEIVDDEDSESDEVGDEKPATAPKPQASPFMKASDDTTNRVISETYDIKTLKDMRRNETRRHVIDKIDAQIVRLQEERRSNRGRVNTDEDA